MDSSHLAGSTGGSASWYQNSDGGLAVWRALTVFILITVASAFIAAAAGMGIAATVAIMTLLVVALGHALVLAPLARITGSVSASTAKRGTDNDTLDALSGIANRRSITSALLNAMAYANRYGHPLSVAMVDLDMLSEINSGLGRKAGDKALQTVAGVFTDTLRMPDRAGRYGEEEFLVLLPNTSLRNAVKIAERLRTGVKGSRGGSAARQIPLTVSIGVCQFRKGEDMERFLSRVNKALAQAKTAGRNRVSTDK